MGWQLIKRAECVAMTFLMLSAGSGCARPPQGGHSYGKSSGELNATLHPFYSAQGLFRRSLQKGGRLRAQRELKRIGVRVL